MSSSRIEELPDDFDEKTKLDDNSTTPAASAADNGPSLDSILAAAGAAFPPKKDGAKNAQPSVPGAAMPPAMDSVKQYSADEIISMMNKMPLFMTTLDETGEDGGENVALEALRALAWEGTRAENAGSFREQGNEQAKLKRWADAREFYNKALAALKMPQRSEDANEDAPDMEVVDLDPEEEARKEKDIEEAALTNRALCNLEMKNYGSCNRDCAAVLRLNPRNVKAWYRSASACFALDKVADAEDACARGLEVDNNNQALKLLSDKIAKRKTQLAELEKWRQERVERKRREESTLKHALQARNIITRSTPKPPEMEDAVIRLATPLDASSTLSIPAMLLYPLHHQTDLIKAFAEDESVGQHLTYIMPLPWDEDQQYTPEGVDCYIETISGGLIKAGKKMALLRILASGKIELVDGLLKIYVLPAAKAAAWIEDFKTTKAQRTHKQ